MKRIVTTILEEKKDQNHKNLSLVLNKKIRKRGRDKIARSENKPSDGLPKLMRI